MADIFLGAYKLIPFYPQVMREVSVRLEDVVGLRLLPVHTPSWQVGVAGQ